MFLDEALQRDLPGFVKGRRPASPIAHISPMCTENLIHVDEVTESPKLVE